MESSQVTEEGVGGIASGERAHFGGWGAADKGGAGAATAQAYTPTCATTTFLIS